MDVHTPSRWSATKRDIHSEQQIRDNPLPSDGAATDKNEEPSWPPHPVHGAVSGPSAAHLADRA